MTNVRLVIDTATSQSTVAVGQGTTIIAEDRRVAPHRHGASLLEQLDAVMAKAGITADDIEAIGVGVGPGSFTGLRIGLATAKTLAYALRVPLVGIGTTDAIRRAAGRPGPTVVVLPAGAHDHYVALPGADPRLVPPGTDLLAGAGDATRIAVDVDAALVGDAAVGRGQEALAGLAQALLAITHERVERSAYDEPATLVPAYVALPRGISAAVEGMTWSPDLR